MRWQVATLAAVWLVILSWCGSTALPVDARPEKAVPANEERATRNNSDGDDLWNLIEESALSEATNEDDNFRRPASQQDVFYVPLKRLPANIDDEPVIFNYAINQPGRSKRQSHFGSVGGHHFGGGQMPQLSISSPIEALRNRLRLEMSRRLDNQIKQNQKLLESVGKRRKRRNASDDDGDNKPASVIKAP